MNYYIYTGSGTFIGKNYESAFDFDHKNNNYITEFPKNIWVYNFYSTHILKCSLSEAKRLVEKFNKVHPNQFNFASEEDIKNNLIIQDIIS